MKTTIITQPNCKWCDQVKHLFDTYDLKYDEVEIGGPASTSLRQLLRSQDITTVPVVFVDGEHIGGYVATQAFIDLRAKARGPSFLNA